MGSHYYTRALTLCLVWVAATSVAAADKDAKQRPRDIYIPEFKAETDSLDTDIDVPKDCEYNDRLFLTSQDRVTGNVTAMKADGFARIINPRYLKDPLEIRMARIERLQLCIVDEIRDMPDSIILTDGGRIAGNVQAVDARFITVRTEAMGETRIKRQYVAALEFQVSTQTLLNTDFTDGNAGPWKPKKGAWRVGDDKYRCISATGGWIAAPVKQTGTTTYDWIVDRQDPSATLTFTIFAKDTSHHFAGDALAVTFTAKQMEIHQVRDGVTKRLARRNIELTASRNRYRLEYDPGSRSIHLRVNEMEFIFLSAKADHGLTDGSYIHLFSDKPVILEQARVVDHGHDIGSDEHAEKSDDTLMVTNKDRVSGTLKRLQDGVAVIETAHGTLNIPKAELQWCLFRRDGKVIPRRRRGDCRVTFHDGTELTMRFRALDETGLDGAAEFSMTGNVRILRRAMRAVQFNIHQ